MKYLIIFIISITLSSCFIRKVQISPEDSDRTEFENIFYEAEHQKLVGNINESVSLYKECTKLNPLSSASFYQLALHYYNIKKLDSSLIYIQKAVAINPDNIWYLSIMADDYQNLSKNNEAIETYKTIIRKFPDKINYYYALAETYTRAAKYELALQTYQKIENISGISPEVSLKKCKIYSIQSDKNKFINELRRLADAYPSEYRYAGMLAEFYCREKQFDEALVIYNDLLKTNSKVGLVRLSLANYYRLTNNRDQTLENLQIAFESPDLDASEKLNTLTGGDESSFREYLTVVEFKLLLDILMRIHPNESLPYQIYAQIALDENDMAKAIDYLTKAVKLQHDNLDAWQQLIQLQLQLFNFKESYNLAGEAIEYFPEQPVFYLFRGIAAVNLGLYTESASVLETGYALVVDNDFLQGQFYYNMAEAYYKLQKYKLSDSYFDKVLKLEPNNKFALNNYSYYLTLRGENLAKAEELIKKCLTFEPLNPNYLDTYAWNLYRQKKYNDALAAIESSMNSGGIGNNEILEHYGDILYKLGRVNDALEKWEKAKRLGNKSDVLQKKIDNKAIVE